MSVDALASIAPKLASIIRMLSSDRDGDVIAAARVLTRTLEGAELDIHVLAGAIGQPGGRLTEAETRKLYGAGFAAGKRAAESEPMFRSVNLDGESSWPEIARECAAHPNQLRDEREKKFVRDMTRRLVHGGEPTEKQRKWLRDIYARVA